MNNLIIKKWIEPYKLLERVKECCDLTEYTFDGINKLEKKQEMLSDISSNNNFALYMKNVNKYYVFTKDDNFNLQSMIVNIFELASENYDYNDDIDYALGLIDIGKAEAVFLNI